jgi:hypothetical protein
VTLEMGCKDRKMRENKQRISSKKRGWRNAGGEIKRPSVETEGRLTIACHMKNLQKIDVVFLQNRTKIKTEMQLNNTKWLKNCRLLNRFDMNLSFSPFSGCKIGDFSEKCKVFFGDFVFFFQTA